MIHTLTLTEEELCSLCWLWKVADNMRKGAEMLYPGLKQLSSQYSGNATTWHLSPVTRCEM
ncbi:P22AR C-terminal domain-containing protein [Erwinia tracheiphila]